MKCGFEHCDNYTLNSKFTAEPIGDFTICVQCFRSTVMDLQLEIKKIKIRKQFEIWGLPE